MANIPESGVIPVDFRQPAEPVLEDDTAAAIAACGLIEIAKAVPEAERGMYLNAALKLLQALEPRCDWSEENDSIVLLGSEAYFRNRHHHPIIYGDYYFLEALLKLKGNELYLW
ncbi:Unsaturated glucuronyl hydrolase [compost metagenome]